MMVETLAYLHILAIAVLVGKVVFLSFVTAPVLARTLDPDSFAKVVRQLFPQYYALGMVAATIGWATITSIGLLKGFGPIDLISSTLWLGILTIENYCRSPLTPRINALSDRLKEADQRGLNILSVKKDRDDLHRLSVQLNSLVLIIGLCLIGLI
ncbi:DUF4149 domain-containing protein [Candidatus Nitronereus thalassa]|uniref:DUF4149 domain-containing protein n=1 Tax=Candidatus Nitronereus thalassa TaxID=3020898 RepID=A0ABU3K830_9BACT|nr:DUF4149 domain-containing protein [Candidatus Nitronereus thalassa]MDT7042517.1 DUF4149 domain-containing protein [Candidatus Nitronereus thalassa]